MKLSSKAQLFVRRAVAEAASQTLRLAARRLGSDPWSRELSPEAAQLARAALDEHRSLPRTRIEMPLTDDEAADLSNHLGFIDAVCSDLVASLKPG